MKLEEFANLILFGTRLADKLISVELESPNEADEAPGATPSPIEIPTFPGRAPRLAKPGKAIFPSIYKLHDPIERAKVLHFFANHELLALELMALALLRFPKAPPSFRRGIGRIMQEEQSHLRLYISRMAELGIEFGDLPVNDYFWNCMKGMRSPLDFTVQMSLTFEQANLDFSLFFMNAIQKTGDTATTAILERVFREEIGHVKHGLIWFNRWRSLPESEWDAYVKLLPLPLTPQRAKGFEFCADARRQAGFTENFIRELHIYSGSKGRPPVVWLYNPHCDSEIARGRPGFTATEGARELSLDLEHIPMFLCQEQDVVLLHNRPRSEWLETLQLAGFHLPELVETKNLPLAEAVRAPKVGGIEPWGWSPDVFQAFQPLSSRLVVTSGGNGSFCKTILACETFEQTGLGKLFSKVWSARYLHDRLTANPKLQEFFGSHELVGTALPDWESARLRTEEIPPRAERSWPRPLMEPRECRSVKSAKSAS